MKFVFLGTVTFSLAFSAVNFAKAQKTAEDPIHEAVDSSTEYDQAVKILNGMGAEKDLSRARQLFQIAANQGNLEAKAALGFMIAEGKGGPKDEAAGAALIGEAAKAGIASAQMNYGQMVQRGRGLSSDWAAAHSWFEKAAAQNYLPAHLELARRYFTREDGAAINHTKALPHMRAAAEAGDAWAQNALGVMHEFGHATAPDKAAALKWYRLSAERGHARGQANAGRLLREQRAGGNENLEAYCWLKLADEQGDVTAIEALKDLESSLTDAQKVEASQQIGKYRNAIQVRHKSSDSQ